MCIRDSWKPDQMFGVGPDYLYIRNATLASGVFFSEREITGANKVCVLGYTVARQLFPDTEAIGQQVRIKNIPFTAVSYTHLTLPTTDLV